MNNCCDGIVLSTREYKDNDMIIHVLTKAYGVLSFVARGIKKANSKNAPACMLFCESCFYFNYRETSQMQSLKTAEKKKMYRHLYEDLNKQAIASLLCEMCMKVEDVDTEYLFALLTSSLSHLDEEDNVFGVLGFFVAKMNALCGVAPNVDGCIYCGDTHRIAGISLYDGGFVCAMHFDGNKHEKVSLERLRYFRLFHKADIDDYSILHELKMYDYEDIKPIVQLFLEYSGIRLQGLAFVEKILTLKPIE